MSGPARWAATFQPGARVLLIANTRPAQPDELERVLAALKDSPGLASVDVIADRSILEWLVERGVARDRILPARVAGMDLEFDEFLSRPTTVRWAVRRQAEFLLGAEANAPSNQEPKLNFERRVAPMLGVGRFVAHSLPSDEVVVLSAEQLWKRAGRTAQLAEHARRTAAALDRLHQAWAAGTEPPSREALWPLPAEEAGAELVAEARGYAHRQLVSAMLVDDYTAPDSRLRIIIDPQGVAPPSGWVVEKLEGFVPEFISPAIATSVPSLTSRLQQAGRRLVSARPSVTTLVARGDMGGPYAYIFRSVAIALREGDSILAEGRLERGGVSLGIEGADGKWARRVDIDEPGSFLAAAVVPRAGTYAFVIANAARGGDHDAGLVVTRFGWASAR